MTLFAPYMPCFDRQMGVEDLEVGNIGQFISRTQYELGARGIEVVVRTTPTTNIISYPLYDAHGNNVGALTKNGTSFALSDEKSYDAWGAVRSGNSNPEYKGRYCANLGHKQDDESGLVYMRARYYEPGSGRFVSEDSAMDGANWYLYGCNNPINLVDITGKNAASVLTGLCNAAGAFIGSLIGYAAMAWFISSANPDFKSTGIFQNAASAFGGFVTGVVSQAKIGSATDAALLGSKGFTGFARTMSNSLAQTGVGRAAGAGGIGLFLGVLAGAYACAIEYFCSEAYRESLTDVFFGGGG